MGDQWRQSLSQVAQSMSRYGTPIDRSREPPMGSMPLPAASGQPVPTPGRTEPTQGVAPRGTVAEEQGTAAVARALAPGARNEPTATGDIAAQRGGEAVDAEMDKALTEQWQDRMAHARGRKIRAGQEGEAAVKGALRPADIRALIQQMMQPPAYTPEESAAIAQTLGQSAVEGATRPPPQLPAGFYPPQMTAPNPMTETTTPDMGYAPASARAAHWGLDAVKRELLNKEPE